MRERGQESWLASWMRGMMAVRGLPGGKTQSSRRRCRRGLACHSPGRTGDPTEQTWRRSCGVSRLRLRLWFAGKRRRVEDLMYSANTGSQHQAEDEDSRAAVDEGRFD